MTKTETKVEKSSSESIYKLSKRSKLLLGIAFGFIILSFILPYFITKYSVIDFTKTGQIGDTLGGIMNPFVAIGGAILTYLAFYIQFKANKLQREQFIQQIALEKDQFKQEFDVQKEQFILSQFENQFYEMIRLHKENVNDLKLDNTNTQGRAIFQLYIEELSIAYYVAKIAFNKDPDYHINYAYGIFFHGLKNEKEIRPQVPQENMYCEFINKLIRIKKSHKSIQYGDLNSVVKHHTKWDDAKELDFKLFQGHSAELAHYYRHLFQTVKFVVNQGSDLLSYSDKRKYLRILRAQLSNHEQVMLFYNWKSDFGKNWENANNKFFTDYRMIHNIYNDLMIQDFNLKVIFKLNQKPYYKREPDRESDPLFEFEDWN
jgi:hypothetical protein